MRPPAGACSDNGGAPGGLHKSFLIRGLASSKWSCRHSRQDGNAHGGRNRRQRAPDGADRVAVDRAGGGAGRHDRVDRAAAVAASVPGVAADRSGGVEVAVHRLSVRPVLHGEHRLSAQGSPAAGVAAPRSAGRALDARGVRHRHRSAAAGSRFTAADAVAAQGELHRVDRARGGSRARAPARDPALSQRCGGVAARSDRSGRARSSARRRPGASAGVGGAGGRSVSVALAVLSGVALALALVPQFAAWTH